MQRSYIQLFNSVGIETCSQKTMLAAMLLDTIYIYMHIHNIFTLSKSWNAKSTSSAAGCSDAFQLEALFRRLDENGVGSCAPEESAQTKTRETKSLRNDVEGTFINGPCAAPGTC